MDSSALKTLFLQRVSLGGNELEAMSQAFSALYRSFQTDVVTRVRCSPVDGTIYTWIDPPSGRSEHVSLFFHGGGYTMGSTDDHLQLIASLVEGSGISVLGVDYRLCPNDCFPAPLDDAEEAYRWLLAQGYRSEVIAVAGISAGATLVTQLLHRCQSKSLPMPSLALVMAGVMDFSYGRESVAFNASDDLVSLQRLEVVSSHYLPGDGSYDSRDLFCMQQDYTSYPRTLFQVGDREVLLSDAIACFSTLKTAGHDVALHVVPGMIHCGQLFARDFLPGQRATAEAALFLREGFSAPNPSSVCGVGDSEKKKTGH